MILLCLAETVRIVGGDSDNEGRVEVYHGILVFVYYPSCSYSITCVVRHLQVEGGALFVMTVGILMMPK